MKVLVIGDSCFDYYVYGKCERLSPEAPAPIFIPNNKKPVRGSGMALNVYNNLKALGVDCDVVTNIDKPRKKRYVDEVSNYLIMRVDENEEVEVISEKTFELIDFEKYDAVVISDYNKGFLTEFNILDITKKHPLVFLDSKKEFDNWANDIRFIKINEKEYDLNKNYFLNRFKNDLIITIGNRGAWHKKENFIKKYNTKKVEVRDVSGAGDTFFAGFVADYLKNNDICKAIEFANKCASYVVTQRGVVSVNLKQIKNDNS